MSRTPWGWVRQSVLQGVHAHLIDSRGRNRCTVWTNGTWHTWNERGVGGENSSAPTVGEAKSEAMAAVLRQGWAVLVSAPMDRKAETEAQ